MALNLRAFNELTAFVVRADFGAQFAVWQFVQRARDSAVIGELSERYGPVYVTGARGAVWLNRDFVRKEGNGFHGSVLQFVNDANNGLRDDQRG